MKAPEYSHHLVTQVARVEAAAAVLRVATEDRPARVARARRRAARHSVRLDASPLDEETAAVVDARLSRGEPAAEAPEVVTAARRGSWSRALRLEGMATQDVAALEYANLLASAEREAELAADLFVQPLATLTLLHGALTRGLLDVGMAGRVRSTSQSVHDGAQGRALWHAPEPGLLPGLLDGLVGWLAGPAAGWPGVVVAGVVHERILQWQPFEAANGRLARTAARLVLRARHIDPDGLMVFEESLAADALGYHAEVAATTRRGGDLVPWLERWADALVEAAETATSGLRGPDPTPPAHALRLVADTRPGQVLTLRDYIRRTGTGMEAARAELRALELRGDVRQAVGSRGLAWRVRDTAAPVAHSDGPLS